MKKSGKIKSIPLQEHFDLLVLLNESIGGAAGSSDKMNLLRRIYKKWKDALPNLEEAPLFKVLGRNKAEADGAIGKIYSFSDREKDGWANLFEYMGSEENVRVKFAIDRIGVSLEQAEIIFRDFRNGEAWEQFIAGLKKGRQEKSESEEEGVVPETPAILETPADPLPSSQKQKRSWFFRYRWAMMALVIGIVAVAGAIWKLYLSPAPMEVAPVDRMKYSLSDKPSIAVLPFVNMSEDPKQEFLCDGMTEEIITALSRVQSLDVIARNSTFTYKGKPVKVKQVSEELGVRYVLEGSLQRSGNRVRIAVQLIDALSGHYTWAERYDRELKGLFALQDEITLKILTAINVKLTGEVEGAITDDPRLSLECYLKLLEADNYIERWNIEGNNTARRITKEVISMCPESPRPYLTLGWVEQRDLWLGNTKSPRETSEKSMEMAKKTLDMDDSIASAHMLLAHNYLHRREYDKAIAEGERAVALSPGVAQILAYHALILHYAGRPEEAIKLYQKAIKINPKYPRLFYMLGNSLKITGRFDEAVSAYKKTIQVVPNNTNAHLNLAATYSFIGREKEARAEAEEVLRINPKFSLDYHIKVLPFKDQSVNEKFNIVPLHKVGLK